MKDNNILINHAKNYDHIIIHDVDGDGFTSALNAVAMTQITDVNHSILLVPVGEIFPGVTSLTSKECSEALSMLKGRLKGILCEVHVLDTSILCYGTKEGKINKEKRSSLHLGENIHIIDHHKRTNDFYSLKDYEMATTTTKNNILDKIEKRIIDMNVCLESELESINDTKCSLVTDTSYDSSTSLLSALVYNWKTRNSEKYIQARVSNLLSTIVSRADVLAESSNIQLKGVDSIDTQQIWMHDLVSNFVDLFHKATKASEDKTNELRVALDNSIGGDILDGRYKQIDILFKDEIHKYEPMLNGDSLPIVRGCTKIEYRSVEHLMMVYSLIDVLNRLFRDFNNRSADVVVDAIDSLIGDYSEHILDDVVVDVHVQPCNGSYRKGFPTLLVVDVKSDVKIGKHACLRALNKETSNTIAWGHTFVYIRKFPGDPFGMLHLPEHPKGRGWLIDDLNGGVISKIKRKNFFGSSRCKYVDEEQFIELVHEIEGSQRDDIFNRI